MYWLQTFTIGVICKFVLMKKINRINKIHFYFSDNTLVLVKYEYLFWCYVFGLSIQFLGSPKSQNVVIILSHGILAEHTSNACERFFERMWKDMWNSSKLGCGRNCSVSFLHYLTSLKQIATFKAHFPLSN